MTLLAASPTATTASGAIRPDLRSWHESSWGRPLAVFVATFGLWLLALAVGLWTERALVRAVMVVPLTFAAGQLFTVGHDAGHGSFSTSRVVNAVAGRLALIPSMHVFGLWRTNHDVHHRYTNLRGRDYVWTPLTVAEYRALPRWRRALHRLYRHPSGLGLGLHYAIEIWAPRMLWPGRAQRARHGKRLLADTVLFYGLLVALGMSAWGFVATIDPDRAGDPRFWASFVFVSLVVPLLGAQWLIGFVIYLNHTHPDIVWYDDPAEWSRHQVQLEGAAGQRFVPLRQTLLPRRIMNHTAHHVDPGVPLRELKGAQQHLVDLFGDRVVSYDWSRKRFRDVLSHCKLYDYDTKRWLTYAVADRDG
ncbi:MAG: fatty acid desaturase [Acidimicrobiia bacterium]|nr:fatty acid desaturase [Acidimicrobiia bacterium]